ncbi:hypothetical protein B1A99_31645 [Cohnella sp. CIP 111063]|uniref:alpha/beta fold hydrolase n=1 Tax=unclassified Cohnella TaxID=2636738 RepID=UPI000B8C2F81|nr:MULTISPECIES: alpha/beta hydrolase [unclassified Cohnella]OXS52910.1 hypothetical protein B1A99_31645 [Cohnella sp. CIP 111063]PRX60162.1 pimeloyl-ACP methyl ester carboxylesterase [Cohnella sp. SGD-V74]
MAKTFRSAEGKRLLLESYDKLLQAWDVPYEERAIDTRFGDTHIITAGETSNPPLLLFHGIGDNSAIMWIHNMKILSTRFHVIAIDTLGGPGKSIPNDSYAKKFDSVLWIDDLLEALEMEKAHMAGVSHGVTLILGYAIHRPERVLKLVGMAGAFPVKGWVSRWSTLKSLSVFFPEMLFPGEKSAIRLLKKLSGPKFDPEVNKELLTHFVYILKYSIPPKRKIAEFAPEDLLSLKDRLIFMIGKYDPVAYQSPMLKFYDHYRLPYKIVEDAGHTLNSEKAEVINKEMIDFLLPAQNF